MRRSYLVLTALVALYCLSRLAVVYYGYSHISHPYFDEPVSGTLTYDLLQGGLRAPLMAYQYEQRSGDMMIEALLMYPLAALFGHSMFTIKLFALLCSLACMLGWVYLINRYFGMTAALLFAALFALPPPMFVRLGLVGTFSSHHMINQILIVQLICLFRMLEKNDRPVPLLLWLVFGLCAGLGTYAFYSYIIFNAFCALFVLCCMPRMISLRGLCALCAGGLIGFAPWLWRTLFYSSGGGSFLAGLFKNISLSPWSFVQTFFHTVPYTLGYGYPGRDIGLAGVIIALLLLVAIAGSIRAAVRSPGAVNALSLHGRFEDTVQPLRLCLFVTLFPVFFLVCLMLSPMQLNPLEYWPTIGIFASFAPADVIRCRWVTILFPFYFAVAALCLRLLFGHGRWAVRVCTVAVCLAVLTLNGVHLTGMLSREDAGKIFLYQGYNFDQYASRLLLPSRSSSRLTTAERIVAGYPVENSEEAWRALGTRLFFEAVARSDAEEYITGYVEAAPGHRRGPLGYGLLRVLHGMPEKADAPWVRALAERYPDIFYKNWGCQFLGYTYYGFMLNRVRLLESLAASERFFFKSFLEELRTGRRDESNRQFVDRVSDHDDQTVERLFMQDIAAVPERYRGRAVQGIGRLVGAEMLFDTLHVPNYPLDSSVGEKFDDDLKAYFYRGVGNGFAETLCRYWRRLMPPDSLSCDRYARGLEIEWQRCLSLMQQMPAERSDLIWEGFLEELEERDLNESIRAFITRRLSMR
ncbi:MAG: glycosyltransferase family 39 protein [Deltaproteobacteria bacterium]|nr:glycosyltransferase family 39 protein [Deltaproteobacteria bacterium]